MNDVVGYVAAFFTTFAMLPQALHVHKTGEVHDLSLHTFAMASIGAVIWILYGALIGNLVLILANLIGFCLVGFICYRKLRAQNREPLQ